MNSEPNLPGSKLPSAIEQIVFFRRCFHDNTSTPIILDGPKLKPMLYRNEIERRDTLLGRVAGTPLRGMARG